MPGFKKYSNDKNKKTQKYAPRPEYKKYRVRTAIKTFRDLEVYKQTTQLSSEIFQLEISAAEKNEGKLIEEAEILYNLSKNIPRLIAESYGDKFSEFDEAMKKLEKTAQLISTVISKIDFLTAAVETQKTKETLTVPFFDQKTFMALRNQLWQYRPTNINEYRDRMKAHWRKAKQEVREQYNHKKAAQRRARLQKKAAVASRKPVKSSVRSQA